MRENIGLFRGKRTDNGEWVYGNLVNYRPHLPWVHIVWFDNSEDGVFKRFEEDVDPDTIGECTGLKDKNGELIFEGDIVRDIEIYLIHLGYVKRGKETIEQANECRDCGAVGVVEFCIEDVGSCGCCFPAFEGSGFKAKNVSLHMCEIIGNIHDNPELLKGGEGE